MLVISNAVIPPELLYAEPFDQTHNRIVFKVPQQSVEEYKIMWPKYASKIVAMDYIPSTLSFNNINDLKDWLSNADINSVGLPYNIALYDLNLETDFYQNDDSLFLLYDALDGKYVNLDLSACGGFVIPDTTSGSIDSRPNKNSIISIILPERITSIGDFAFYDCRNFYEINLPAGLLSIGNWAFGICRNLLLTELPAGITSIGEGAFYSCINITFTELPAGLTSIRNQAFSSCFKLTLTELPTEVTSIGNQAFSGCTSLALIKLPERLTSIGFEAFYNSNLTRIELPAGIATIGFSAFALCSNLELVICHATTPPIQLGMGGLFSLTSSSLEIKVPEQSIDAYKSSWSEYADRIVAIE